MSGPVQVVICPGCGSKDVRPSYPAGLWDKIMSALEFTALRCRSCRKRFYRRVVRHDEPESVARQPDSSTE